MATSSDMLPPSEVAAGGYDQDRRQRHQSHTLTPEEIKTFQECSNESFKYRALPLGLLAAFGVQYAVKVGYLAPHPKYGPYLKMFGAGFAGWLVGKISYRRQCEEKLMKLPNSSIGEALRRKYGISSPDAVMGSQSGDYASLSGQDRYSGDLGSQSLDLRSYNAPQGLDDSQRPSMDNPVIAEVPENLPPANCHHLLCHSSLHSLLRSLLCCLRLKSFDGRTERGYPTRIPSSAPSGGGTGKKNKYGDNWED
ncbi:hypothetical protein MRX96_029097 [Rhipicephalus microplus]